MGEKPMKMALGFVAVITVALAVTGCTANHAAPLSGTAGGNVVIKRTSSLAI
jgi:hypothetical protein